MGACPSWGRDPRTNDTHTLLWLLETFRTSRYLKIPTLPHEKCIFESQKHCLLLRHWFCFTSSEAMWTLSPPSQKHACTCLLQPYFSFAHRSGQQRPLQENETNTSARHLDTDKHAYMPNGWNKKPKYKSVLTKMLQPNFTNATLLRFKRLLQKCL